MKFYAIALTAAASAALLTGCQYPNGEANNTGTGALVGGGIGAASGAVIGGPRNAGAGAVIGGAIGAIAGSIVGSSMDEEQRERLRAEAPQTYERVEQGQPLATADIKAMAQAGVSDDIMIAQIRNSHAVYHLSSADIIDLHNAGVSDRVIDAMIGTASATTTVVQGTPPPAPQTDVIVGAPGPDYVWVDGEWTWGGVRWVWTPGRWVYHPGGGIWVRGYWYHGPRGWYHSPGYWRRR